MHWGIKIIPWHFIMKNILASSIKWAIKDINKLLCPAFQQLLVVYQVVIQLSTNILQLKEVNAFNRATSGQSTASDPGLGKFFNGLTGDAWTSCFQNGLKGKCVCVCLK